MCEVRGGLLQGGFSLIKDLDMVWMNESCPIYRTSKQRKLCSGLGSSSPPTTSNKESVRHFPEIRESTLSLYIYLSIYLPIYLSICLSVCLSICLSIYLSICPSVCLSVCLSICLSVRLSVCLSIYLSIYLPIYLSICLSVYLSICLSIYLSIYLSVRLSICLSISLSVRLSICLSIYLSIYLSMTLQPFLGPWSFFSFLIFYTVGRTSLTGDQPITRPLHPLKGQQTQTPRTLIFMRKVGFEPTTAMFWVDGGSSWFRSAEKMLVIINCPLCEICRIKYSDIINRILLVRSVQIITLTNRHHSLLCIHAYLHSLPT
jgi:hypothetical protein